MYSVSITKTLLRNYKFRGRLIFTCQSLHYLRTTDLIKSSCRECVGSDIKERAAEKSLPRHKKVLSQYEKRFSNPIIDEKIQNKKRSFCRNFCHMKAHNVRKIRLPQSSSVLFNSSCSLNTYKRSSKSTYRRTQSNSIFELCSCLSTSSINSTASSS